MSNNYVSGRAFEYRVKHWYLERGYVVVRSAQSKGMFDLVALKAGADTDVIQCKYSRKRKPKFAVAEAVLFRAAARKAGARGVLASGSYRSPIRFKVLEDAP